MMAGKYYAGIVTPETNYLVTQHGEFVTINHHRNVAPAKQFDTPEEAAAALHAALPMFISFSDPPVHVNGTFTCFTSEVDY